MPYISNKRELHWLYVQMYLETWKHMFLRRSLASLARAYKLLFFSSVGNTKKLVTLVVLSIYQNTQVEWSHLYLINPMWKYIAVLVCSIRSLCKWISSFSLLVFPSACPFYTLLHKKICYTLFGCMPSRDCVSLWVYFTVEFVLSCFLVLQALWKHFEERNASILIIHISSCISGSATCMEDIYNSVRKIL